MSDLQELQTLAKSITEIKVSSNYWFIRTQAGAYFDEFIEKQFIGIGHNEVTLEDIREALKNGDNAKNVLRERVKKIYKGKEKQTRFIPSQLLRFAQEIKVNDIIIIPSENSSRFAFGRVKSEIFVSGPPLEKECPYRKRRNVEWIKIVNRHYIDPKLYAIMFSHQAINNANDYAEYIDRQVSSLFIKDGNAHLVLNVTARGSIKFEDMFGFGGVVPLIRDFINEEGLQIDTGNIESKMSVQSPGVIEIISNPYVIILIGMLIGVVGVAFSGGTTEVKFKKVEASLTVKTDGLINRMQSFFASRNKDKALAAIVKKTVDTMGVKSPKEIEELVKILTKK